MDVKQFQPKFIHRGRTWSNNLWRIALIAGLVLNTANIPVALIRTDWTDLWESCTISAAFWLVIMFERTLDRWEPWVPPFVKGRRP